MYEEASATKGFAKALVVDDKTIYVLKGLRHFIRSARYLLRACLADKYIHPTIVDVERQRNTGGITSTGWDSHAQAVNLPKEGYAHARGVWIPVDEGGRICGWIDSD
eukprot:1058773-Pyramimonas_sp.AAC.1